MKLFVATHNAHKIREIAQILPSFEIIPDDPEGVEENADDFIGNAFIKVRAIAARHPGEWCMADDSGLEVKSLGGAPGVRSARYAGEPSDTPRNNALLLKNLEGAQDRAANFTCAVALVAPRGAEHEAVGKCFGRIASSPSGAEGFGYDPLFIPDGHDRSFAELSADEKNAISHRGRALEKVKEVVNRASRAGFRARILGWLRLFRVVNLPTVPGDVLVGVAAVAAFAPPNVGGSLKNLACAAAASVAFYMFGLADNDLAGMRRDSSRPIPEGLVSPLAASLARALCLLAGCALGAFAGLPLSWWAAVILLLICIVLYNRTKVSFLMGLCRGLNVLCGTAAFSSAVGVPGGAFALAAAAVWTVYIAFVTGYSAGEENDPAKKRKVGLLIGGIVYLQLIALMIFALVDYRTVPLLAAGGALLVLLRIARRMLPGVSAS